MFYIYSFLYIFIYLYVIKMPFYDKRQYSYSWNVLPTFMKITKISEQKIISKKSRTSETFPFWFAYWISSTVMSKTHARIFRRTVCDSLEQTNIFLFFKYTSCILFSNRKNSTVKNIMIFFRFENYNFENNVFWYIRCHCVSMISRTIKRHARAQLVRNE